MSSVTRVESIRNPQCFQKSTSTDLFAKKPLFMGLFCRRWALKIRHPTTLASENVHPQILRACRYKNSKESFTLDSLVYVTVNSYGVATISRLLKIIGLVCKRALWKRRDSAKETYIFKAGTHRSHPIRVFVLVSRKVQPIAFGGSFNLNLQSQSHWSLFIRMWQNRPRELDHQMRFEIEEMTLQMQKTVERLVRILRNNRVSLCLVYTVFQGVRWQIKLHIRTAAILRPPVPKEVTWAWWFA